MSYEWITPKTDWTTTTRFEYTDYNRIRNNLLYINDMLNELYPDKAQPLDLGDAKTGYANEYAVSEFNAFEEALESFTRIGQDVNVGDRNYYRGNDSFIWADALNRLEQCCLRWGDLVTPAYKEYDLPYMFANGGQAVIATDGYSGNSVPKLHILGGGSNGFSGDNRHYYWDFTSKEWTRGTDLPYPLFSGIAINLTRDNIISANIYLFGGISSELEGRTECYILIPSSSGGGWTRLQRYDFPYKIMGAAVCKKYNQNSTDVYVIGGKKEIYEQSAEDGKIFCLSSSFPSSWTDETPFDQTIKFVDNSSVYFNDSILITNGLKVYSKQNNSLNEFCNLPHLDNGGKLIVCRENLYYFGGSSTDLAYYKYNNGEFKKVSSLPYPFQYGCIIDFDSYIYVIGGNNANMKSKMLKILKY